MINEKIVSLLKKDLYRNINVLNFIDCYPVTAAYTVGDSVVVKGISDQTWIFIYSNSKTELMEITAGLDRCDRCFAIIEEWMEPIIIGKRSTKWQMKTDKFILPDDVPIPDVAVDIVPLTTADAPMIVSHSHYQQFLTEGYICERIEKDVNGGIRIDGQLVAWAMTHDDGALGSLHVRDDYRRRGFGREVTLFLIHELRKLKRLPFAHVEPTNTRSLNMVRQMGFRLVNRVSWFELEK